MRRQAVLKRIDIKSSYVYSCTNKRIGDIFTRDAAISPLESIGACSACASVRATDAPLRDGRDPPAAAQGGQHQAALRLALHGDRSSAASRIHHGTRDRKRRPTPRTHGLRDHACGARRVARLDDRSYCRAGEGISTVRGGTVPATGAAARGGACAAAPPPDADRDEGGRTQVPARPARAPEVATAVRDRVRVPAGADDGRAAFHRRRRRAPRKRLGPARPMEQPPSGPRSDTGKALSGMGRRADELKIQSTAPTMLKHRRGLELKTITRSAWPQVRKLKPISPISARTVPPRL